MSDSVKCCQILKDSIHGQVDPSTFFKTFDNLLLRLNPGPRHQFMPTILNKRRCTLTGWSPDGIARPGPCPYRGRPDCAAGACIQRDRICGKTEGITMPVKDRLLLRQNTFKATGDGIGPCYRKPADLLLLVGRSPARPGHLPGAVPPDKCPEPVCPASMVARIKAFSAINHGYSCSS